MEASTCVTCPTRCSSPHLENVIDYGSPGGFDPARIAGVRGQRSSSVTIPIFEAPAARAAASALTTTP